MASDGAINLYTKKYQNIDYFKKAPIILVDEYCSYCEDLISDENIRNKSLFTVFQMPSLKWLYKKRAKSNLYNIFLVNEKSVLFDTKTPTLFYYYKDKFYKIYGLTQIKDFYAKHVKNE